MRISHSFQITTQMEDLKNSQPTKTKRADPPSPPGDHIEPYTHMVCNKSAEQLFAVILECFALVEKESEHKIKFENTISKDRYRVNCMAFTDQVQPVVFVIRIFQLKSNLAIEFQRRSGDLIVFADIWDISRRHFLASQVALVSVDLKPRRKRGREPDFSDVDIPEASIQDSLNTLLSMMSSPYAKVSEQGIDAIVSMSSCKLNHKAMLSNESLVEKFASLLEDGKATNRSAVLLFSRLCYDQAMAQKMVQKGVLVFLQSWRCPPSLKEECAHLLESLSKVQLK